MKNTVKWFLSCTISGLTFLSSANVFAGSTSGIFHFDAEFVGGGCEISSDAATIQFNGGNPILPSEIEAATLAGSAKTLKTFNIKLTGCNGWGLIPKIQVTGEKTTDFGSNLFRNNTALTANDSNGYGLLLTTKGNSTFQENSNLASHNTITVKSDWGTASRDLNTIDKTLPISAVLTCGDCNYGKRQGGKFTATVTFDFIYD